jgi:hypothetical protein
VPTTLIAQKRTNPLKFDEKLFKEREGEIEDSDDKYTIEAAGLCSSTSHGV